MERERAIHFHMSLCGARRALVEFTFGSSRLKCHGLLLLSMPLLMSSICHWWNGERALCHTRTQDHLVVSNTMINGLDRWPHGVWLGSAPRQLLVDSDSDRFSGAVSPLVEQGHGSAVMASVFAVHFAHSLPEWRHAPTQPFKPRI